MTYICHIYIFNINAMSNKALSLFAILLSVVAIFLFYTSKGSSASAQDSFGKIVAQGSIRVCYVPFPPSLVKDPATGNLTGFMIETMNTIANTADLKVKYVETTRWGFAADLNADKCDMWLGFYPLLNRAKTISFSKPFYFNGNNVMIKSDSNFSSIAQLNNSNVKIAVIQWEFGHLYAQKFLPQAKLVVLDASSDSNAPLLAVVAGQADAGMFADDVISAFIAAHSGVRKISEKPYSTTPDAFGVRQSDQSLLNFLNTAIDMLQAQWEFEAIGKRANSMRYAQWNNYIPLNK